VVAESGTRIRLDIQALRGLAVLLVLIYHADLGVLSAGYLGVDVFFVVSGFLITGIIAREIRAGSFSFARFYLRRARRLLPAAYTMLVVTSAAAALLLSSSQFREFLAQLAGSVFFLANVVLWKQTGYFAEAAHLKPLLHMWSLSLEEQYYLVVPLLFVLVPRRFWLPLVIVASAASLAAAVLLAAYKPSVAFFMLPTRAWELGIGSVGALLAGTAAARRVSGYLFLPSVAVLAVIPCFPLDLPHPGANALLVCAATLFIILAAKENAATANPAVRGLAWVGDFSYSLYLVHWPLFALTRAAFMTPDLPTELEIALVLASLVLGWLLYRLVEIPTRSLDWRPRRLTLTLVAASLATLVLPAALLPWKQSDAAVQASLQPNRGIGCQTGEGAGLVYDTKCAESQQPQILVWGDSLSAHLIPAVVETTGRPVAQASAGMCAPILGMAAIQGPNEQGFGEGCIGYNRSVIQYVKETPSIETVALTGAFLRFFLEETRLVRANGDGFSVTGRDDAAVLQGLTATIAQLKGLGRRVVIVSPPPQARFDIGRCWERVNEGVPNFGAFHGCGLTRETFAYSQDKVYALLDGAGRAAGVPVIRLDRILCERGTCITAVDGRSIYRDETHFNDWGSALVGRRIALGTRVWNEAR
jgi:peptidoglycan/LPS O-acetylase OafA/YrhL